MPHYIVVLSGMEAVDVTITRVGRPGHIVSVFNSDVTPTERTGVFD